jgi:hypothetical protein
MSAEPPSPARRARRSGPAPLALAERRTHCVSVRLSARELAQLEAARGRMTRGTWLRRAALEGPPRTVPEVNRQAWAQLARVSGNFNQLIAAINGGRADAVPEDLLHELREAVAAVRAGLIGAAL